MPSVARVNPSQTSTEKRITTPKKAIVKLLNIKSITKNTKTNGHIFPQTFKAILHVFVMLGLVNVSNLL